MLDKIKGRLTRPPATSACTITFATAFSRQTLKFGLEGNVLNLWRIMRGYHIRIRVTAQSTPTTTPASSKPARAAWVTDTFIPKSIFESLPSHTPRKTSRKNAILGSKRKDYRYGPIRIDWLDLESTSRPSSSITQKPLRSAKTDTMDTASIAIASGNGKEKVLRERSEPSGLGSRFCETHTSSRRSSCSKVCT